MQIMRSLLVLSSQSGDLKINYEDRWLLSAAQLTIKMIILDKKRPLKAGGHSKDITANTSLIVQSREITYCFCN